jgi:hypothetical protein
MRICSRNPTFPSLSAVLLKESFSGNKDKKSHIFAASLKTSHLPLPFLNPKIGFGAIRMATFSLYFSFSSSATRIAMSPSSGSLGAASIQVSSFLVP